MNVLLSFIRHLWHHHWRAILITLALVVVFLWLAVLVETRTDKLTDDVWTVELVGRCYLDNHSPIHAVALACPGVDYIKLWPLPVEQPWHETPIRYPIPGRDGIRGRDGIPGRDGIRGRDGMRGDETPPSEAGSFVL